MSALDLLKAGATNNAPVSSVHSPWDQGAHGATALGWGVDKLERIVASGGFGFIKGYYREKSLVFGTVPVDILAGTTLTLLAAGLNLASSGRSKLAQHIDRVGDAGVMSFFNSLGASWGASAAKYQVAVVPASAKLPAGSAPMVLGSLPQASGGTYLTAEELAKHSSAQ